MVQDTVINIPRLRKKEQIGWKQKYLNFCDQQMKQRTLWYLIPLMSLSAAIMPISIFLMSYFEGYIVFVAISILLFFGNIILSIADQPTRVTITFYLLTLLVHFLVPLISLILFIL